MTYLAKITLRSGQVIKFKCKELSINKAGNEITGIKYIGVDNGKHEDKLWYLRIDAIDHIYLRKLIWGIF